MMGQPFDTPSASGFFLSITVAEAMISAPVYVIDTRFFAYSEISSFS